MYSPTYNFFLLAFYFLFLLPIFFSCGSATKEQECLPHPPLYAFYYPWYGTPEVSGEWRHWNIAGHNPDKISNGRRDIASVRHPYPDVYDSSDPSTIKRHIELAKKAGIDAFIFSWWGRGTFEDNVLKTFARISEEEGFKFSIYYEGTFVWYQDIVKSYQNIISYIENDLSHLSQYFDFPNYLKIEGKPVVFIYGRAFFPPFWCAQEECASPFPQKVTWTDIIRKFQNLFFVADDISFFIPSPYGFRFRDELFDMGFRAFHAYNPYFESYRLLGKKNMDEYYEIFSDYVSDARRRKAWVAITILPGYDDTALDRRFPWKLPRMDGETLRKLYTFSVKLKPDAILLVSFNEWHEGTEIEPSFELGEKYINLLAELRNSCIK